MKQLPLLCFTLFISLYCQAQVYHSFLHDTAIWDEDVVDISGCDAGSGDASGYFRELIMMGDTEINSLRYKKFYYQNYLYYIVMNGKLVYSSYNNLPPIFTGVIREDSSEKIYFLNLDSNSDISACSGRITSNTEILLYDFNLHVGDSLIWKPYNNRVIEIDSIQTENGTYLPVFYFDSIHIDSWTEGLGSSLGFFGAYDPLPFECNCTLNCAQATEFLNPGEKPCGGIYTSVPQPQEHSKLVVFPNPAHDKIILNFSLLKNTPATISILNETGQIVWNKNETVYRGNLIEEIPVTDLSRGIYFVRIETPEGSFVKMILLQ